MWTFRRRSYQLRWDISSADNIRLKRNHQFPLSADSGGRLFRGKSSTVEDYFTEMFHGRKLFRGKVPQWKTIPRKSSTVEDYFAEKFPQWKTISWKCSTAEIYSAEKFHSGRLFRGKNPQWKTISRKCSMVVQIGSQVSKFVDGTIKVERNKWRSFQFPISTGRLFGGNRLDRPLIGWNCVKLDNFDE